MRNLAGGSASAKAKAVYLCLPCSDCETLGHCCLITRVIQCTKHPTTFIDFSILAKKAIFNEIFSFVGLLRQARRLMRTDSENFCISSQGDRQLGVRARDC